MLFRIKEIGLFQGAKKDVIGFNSDINFISGESNTGKSSIGEIIDYCLGSSTQTIPAGKITNEIDMFAISVNIDNHSLILARNRFEGNDFNGSKFIFVQKIKDDFSFQNIELNFFTVNSSCYLTIDNFLELEIPKYFHTFPPKTRLDGREMVRPTVRNMPPFMFQTQDVIKAKRQLFYKMEGVRAKSVKRDFELFLGLVDSNLYNKVNRINEIKKELKKIENRTNFYQDELKKSYFNLRGYYQRLFAHLNQKINVDSLENLYLLDLKNIDQLNLEYKIDANISNALSKLEAEANQQSRLVEQLKIEYFNIKNQIEHIDTANLKLQTTSNVNYQKHCPICDSKVEKAFEFFEIAKKKILEEKDFLKHCNSDLLREKELAIKTQLDTNKETLNGYIKQLNDLRKDVAEIQTIEKKKQLLFELKGAIKQTIAQIEKYEKDLNADEEVTKLKSELEELEKELSKNDIKKRRQEAELLIGKYSTEMLTTLPFDKQSYEEPNLKFDIRDVNAYQQGSSNIFYISDLGSAENHLSFHISLFLGLHKYILENTKSILPSFIFLDQPSQVYFPKEDDFKSRTGDIKKVEDMYKSIIAYIDACNQASLLSKIQIIIVDHFYTEDEWYQKYLVEPRWEKDKNLGLIKDVNI